MARRKPRTKRFNQRYGTKARSDLHQQRNDAVLKSIEAERDAKPKAAARAKPAAEHAPAKA
jgi:hypothetical protein